jgi:hypothetical protein
MGYQPNQYTLRIQELGFEISFEELDDYIGEFIFNRPAMGGLPAIELVIGVALVDIADQDTFMEHCRQILDLLKAKLHP